MQGVSAPRVNPRMSSPFHPQWRPGYEEDCGGGGSQDRSGLMTLQRLLYHRSLASSQSHGRVDPFLQLCQDGLFDAEAHFLSLSPYLAALPPTDSHTLRAPRSPRDWWIKSVSVGRLGGKKRKTSERFIQRVFPITRLFALSREFDGLFGSSPRLSPSILPSMIWLSWNQSSFVLIIWTVCSDGHCC